jgi:hypothetical protein
MVMEKFDSLEPFTIWERLHFSLSLLLMQPLLSIINFFPQVGDFLPGFVGYIAFILNSFLWALMIWYFVVLRIKNRRIGFQRSSADGEIVRNERVE